MGKKELEKKSVGVKPLGTCVIIKLKTETESGIILTASSDTPLDTEVVAVGDDVKKVKAGDKVMAVGASYMFTADDEDYCLIYESQILMIVEDGCKVVAINKGGSTKEF